MVSPYLQRRVRSLAQVIAARNAKVAMADGLDPFLATNVVDRRFDEGAEDAVASEKAMSSKIKED